MEAVTVKKGEFSHHASKYITTLEQKGGSILITSRGVPIAKVIPIEKDKKWDLSPLRILKQEGDINDPILPPMDL